MTSLTNNVISAAAACFGASLIQQGYTAINNPLSFTKTFGAPMETTTETLYIQAAGVRELFFGAAIASLVVAGKLNVIEDGLRAAALTTAAAACVGFGDGLLTRAVSRKVAVGHGQGGAVLALIALGLWLTAP